MLQIGGKLKELLSFGYYISLFCYEKDLTVSYGRGKYQGANTMANGKPWIFWARKN